MNVKKYAVALSVIVGLVCILASPSANAAEQKKVITVQSGDTLTKIAKANGTTYVQLFNANANIANPDVIDVGDKIRIPAKDEKLPDRFSKLSQSAPTASATTRTQSKTQSQSSSRSSSQAPRYSSASGNTYYWGQCTWYAKSRRPDLPNMLGNGGSWVANAAARGLATGRTPRAGAIAEIPGHVMYVEKVNGNGTISISEMNYGGGVGVVNRRTISAGSVSGYIY